MKTRVLAALGLAFATLPMLATGQASAVGTAPGTYVPVESHRILDTRNGTGTTAGAVASGATRTVDVAGPSGVPVGASAAVVNVTVTGATKPGYFAIYPASGAVPATSNLNFRAGQTVANHVTVKLSSGGRITLKNGSTGAAHMIADVSGYYIGGTPAAGGTFHALNPARILDTRKTTHLAANATRTVQITNAGGIPASGVGSAVLNVTVTNTAAAGNLRAFPTGGTVPGVSNLNYVVGATVTNAVTVAVSGTGQVTFKNSSTRAVDLIVDVNGYFSTYDDTAVPGSFEGSVPPVRWFDSRVDFPGVMDGYICYLIGSGSVPGIEDATVYNVTVTQPQASGFLVVYPGDLGSTPTPPSASNINFTRGLTIANLTTTGTTPDPDTDPETTYGDFITVCNGSPGKTHVILDYAGSYWTDGPLAAGAPAAAAERREQGASTASAAERTGPKVLKVWKMPGH